MLLVRQVKNMQIDWNSHSPSSMALARDNIRRLLRWTQSFRKFHGSLQRLFIGKNLTLPFKKRNAVFKTAKAPTIAATTTLYLYSYIIGYVTYLCHRFPRLVADKSGAEKTIDTSLISITRRITETRGVFTR